MATKVNPRQLKINAIDTGLIKDGSITIDDINVAVANKSLITKIVAGSNVSISYTGADPGTGVVTVNANSNLNASILLSTLLSIDGSSSGIDADLLDGYHASFFAPLDSPSFIGIPVAPTATTGTNTTQIATTAFVNSSLYSYDGSSNLTIAGALVASSLDITNNLTVNGSITTIKSTTLTTNDLIITIGGITNPISNDNKDRGIEFRWHNGSTNKLGFFGYDSSTGYLTFIPDATNTNDVISGVIGDIQATTFYGNLVGNVTGNITGNIDTATKLGTSRSISITGDIGWSVNFDGSANVTAAAILPNIAAAGTYKSATFNAKGQFISGSNPTTLSGFGITDAQLLNANLTSLSALSTNGIISYTGNNTLSARAITGTTNQISITNGNGVLDNPVISIAANPIIPGTSSLTIPIGTTAERPISPSNGMLRYNSTLSMFEFYQVNSWISISAATPSAGFISQTIVGTITAKSGTTIIPYDNTPPLITEGTQIWTGSITPQAITSRIGISFTITVDASQNNRTLIIPIFRGNTCITAIINEIDTSNHPKNMNIIFVDTPSTLSPVTYSARMGVDASASWHVNSTGSGNNLGGILISNYRLDEIS